MSDELENLDALIRPETSENEVDKMVDAALVRYFKRKGRMVFIFIVVAGALITATVGAVGGIKTILGWLGFSIMRG